MLKRIYKDHIERAENKIRSFKNRLNNAKLSKKDILQALKEIEDWEKIRDFYVKELKNIE